MKPVGVQCGDKSRWTLFLCKIHKTIKNTCTMPPETIKKVNYY